MRILIIGALALLVLGGGGAGAYFYFSQSANAAAGEEVGEQHEAAKEKHEKEKKKSEHVEFIELDPLILPIVDSNGVSQVVSVVIALEVADKDAAGKVEKMTPRLKDAFIRDMYGVLNKHAALEGGVIKVSAIKSRLSRVSNDVMGSGVISDVLLQVVQQRPI